MAKRKLNRNPCIEEIIKELERELAQRTKVYPRLIQQDKLNKITANNRHFCLVKAISELKRLKQIDEGEHEKKVGKQTEMFI